MGKAQFLTLSGRDGDAARISVLPIILRHEGLILQMNIGLMAYSKSLGKKEGFMFFGRKLYALNWPKPGSRFGEVETFSVPGPRTLLEMLRAPVNFRHSFRLTCYDPRKHN